MLKAYEISGNILFEENQKYPSWVSWAVRLAMLVTILGLLIGLILGNDKTDAAIALAVVIPVAIAVIYLNSNIQFQKTVTSNGLYYRWKPWQKKFRVIEKEDIDSFTTRNFALLSYGSGWFPTYGWYHNLSRGQGIQLFLKNGSKFFFSTYNIELFERAFQSLVSSKPKSTMSEP